ncbi:MAG: OsmC family protein [Alphaproteobacteria bacterium]|nr:OsmC family protein [Alphaproteobacteria bacterium]MDE1987853.1 OsmC family protein [Alphaproteobacteria bacterium]MDE2163334.1 OsmC family protein [Alphaproteobacteria bacterium]MDE2265018.1 OsmC family protein [Alphaproteobacteria bacterium]MDE2629354.1 OsmC family protein [Alphaproteobacteria bacterium]
MSEHHATIRWNRTSADYTYDTYNRAHEMTFKDGAVALPASSAPDFKGDAERVNPEEAFVAALSSCHMLTFLAICARKHLTVESYEDAAVGVLDRAPSGKLWMARVTLRPQVRFAAGVSVDAATLADLHHKSHENCFIANSVTTAMTVEPRG